MERVTMKPSSFCLSALLILAAPASAEPVGNWMGLVGHAQRIASSANPLWRTPASTRPEAQVALAMFEAANAADRRYASYLGLDPAPGASVDAAAAAAAHQVLTTIFPDQRRTFDDALTVALA